MQEPGLDLVCRCPSAEGPLIVSLSIYALTRRSSPGAERDGRLWLRRRANGKSEGVGSRAAHGSLNGELSGNGGRRRPDWGSAVRARLAGLGAILASPPSWIGSAIPINAATGGDGPVARHLSMTAQKTYRFGEKGGHLPSFGVKKKGRGGRGGKNGGRPSLGFSKQYSVSRRELNAVWISEKDKLGDNESHMSVEQYFTMLMGQLAHGVSYAPPGRSRMSGENTPPKAWVKIPSVDKVSCVFSCLRASVSDHPRIGTIGGVWKDE